MDMTRPRNAAPPASDTLVWNERTFGLTFHLGEWPIWAPRISGIAAAPDPFVTPALTDPGPPEDTLARSCRRAAYLYSCPVEGALPTLALRGNWLRYVVSHYPHYSVDVSGSFERYIERFRGRTRSTLRRRVRRAEETNQDCPLIRRYDAPASFAEFFELALPISRQSYQQRLFRSGLPEGDTFRKSVEDRAARGDIIGFILFLHDRPAAYTLCPRTTPGVVLYDQTGYDPACEQFSPGTVLQYRIIEALCADPRTRTYDLCVGGGRHKELFATDERACANIYFLHLASWPAAAAVGHMVLRMGNIGVKKTLTRLRLKDRVKKIMRRWK